MDLNKLTGETTEYEKKVMLESRRPKSWLKSVSAFANGIGGVIIFGIDNDDNVVGLDNAKKDAEIISEQINVKMDPVPDIKIKFRKIGHKTLILLEVFAGKEPPYFYISDGNCLAFRRVGNESIIARGQKLKELTLKGSNLSYDKLVSHYELNNFSFTKLKHMYKLTTGKEFNDTDLESFGLATVNGMLTNAGALMADEAPIYQSRLFCTRWNGLNKASGLIDALDDKEYSEDLISLLQDGMKFVLNNSKVMWRKLPATRQQLPDYPERSVQEGLVNALIHRQYLTIGSEVHIDMFDDRLEIYSPGDMPDGTKIHNGELAPRPSNRRNPVIADLFTRMAFMERRGSGFKKICDAYSTQEYYDEEKKPVIYSDHDAFILTLWNLNYLAGLNENRRKICRVLGDNKNCAQEKLAEIAEIPLRTVQREMTWLEKNGYIKRQGGKKLGRWQVLEKNKMAD